MALLLIAELVALVGGTVLTMAPSASDPASGDAPVTYDSYVGTVLIEDGMILEAGPAVVVSEQARIIDVTGLFIVPGLIDAHVHFDPDHDALYTAAGVTTVRDVGGARQRLLDLRDYRDAVPGPKLLTAGAVLGGYPPASPEAAIFETAADVDRLLPILLGEGVDFLSIFPNMPEAAWRRTVELGLEHGFQSWSPVTQELGLMTLIAAGQRGFFYMDSLLPPKTEWGFVQPIAFKRNIAAFVENNAAIVPMLRATEQRLDDSAPDEELRSQFFQYMSSHYEAWWREDRAFRDQTVATVDNYLQTGERVVQKQLKVLAMLGEAGGHLVPGSGAPNPWLMPGAGLVDELLLWQTAGLSPESVLAAATVDAAETLGLAGSRGRIRAGYAADLICLKSDPRINIANLYSPETVVVRGKVLLREDLLAMRSNLASELAEQKRLAKMPLEVGAPDTPEGEIVLQGFIESSVRGSRISGERYAVVREPDGGTAFCGRVVTLGEGPFLGTDLSIVQRMVDGELHSIFMKLEQGPDILTMKGYWAGERFHLEKRLNGVFLKIPNSVSPEHPVTIELGSVTSLLMLGQTDRTGRMPVMFFHEGFEPEVVAWELAIAEEMNHYVKTQRGIMGFAYSDLGGISSWTRKTGDPEISSDVLTVEIKVIQETAFGGPGMPILDSKVQTFSMLEEAVEVAPEAELEPPVKTNTDG